MTSDYWNAMTLVPKITNSTGTPERKTLLAWIERLRDFDRPVLVAWATEDRLMPREHGPRLAELYPQGRLIEIADSSPLVPEDQPERLAEVLTDFLIQTGEFGEAPANIPAAGGGSESVVHDFVGDSTQANPAVSAPAVTERGNAHEPRQEPRRRGSCTPGQINIELTARLEERDAEPEAARAANRELTRALNQNGTADR